MYNNVVEAALEALWDKGFATLRFNFRGVGESEGSYGGGAGEAQDAASAINYMRTQPGLEDAPMVLVGYSFGAAAAWQAAPQAGELEALVLIAAPLRMMDTRIGAADRQHPSDWRLAGFFLSGSGTGAAMHQAGQRCVVQGYRGRRSFLRRLRRGCDRSAARDAELSAPTPGLSDSI